MAMPTLTRDPVSIDEKPRPAIGSQDANFYPEWAVLGLDLESFRWQESTFAMLSLALLAALLCGHALFSEHFARQRRPWWDC